MYSLSFKLRCLLGIFFTFVLAWSAWAGDGEPSSTPNVSSQIGEEKVLPKDIVVDKQNLQISDFSAKAKVRLWLTAVTSPERLQNYSQAYVLNAKDLPKDRLLEIAADKDASKFVWKLDGGMYSKIYIPSSIHCRKAVFENKKAAMKVGKVYDYNSVCAANTLKFIKGLDQEKLYVLSPEKLITNSEAKKVLVGPEKKLQ